MHVGYSWLSVGGPRVVVEIGPHPRIGETVYVVTTGESRVGHLYTLGELAFEQRRDEARLASLLAERATAAPVEGTSWSGFTSGMKAPARARVHAALSKQVGVSGVYDERGAHIRDLVRRGYRVRLHPSRGRILEGPSGSFYDERALTKIGLDFADYLTR